jgi:hypothetical protein
MSDLYNRFEIDCVNGQNGLKALRSFRQGETILTLPPYTQLVPDKYSIQVGPETHVKCVGSFAGAINHSCVPNAAVKNWRVIAWSCIKAGDPITIDYKRTEVRLAEPFDCLCGHQLCLGRIE